MARLLDERVQEEPACTNERGVEAREVSGIAAILVMLPEILAEPGAAGWPEAPGPVDRGRCAPEVSVMVSHPAAGTPVHFGRAGARLGQVHDHGVQRLDTLGQVARLGRPVIHLGVDVDGVLAAPRRVHAGIPQALQRRRLSAWSRAAQQEVTAELKVESHELRVVAACEPPDPLVGRPPLGVAVAHVKCDPPEHALMLGHVSLLDGLVRFRGRRVEARKHVRSRVATCVVESLVTRCGGNEHHDRVGFRDGDGLTLGGPGTALVEDPHAGIEREFPGNTLRRLRCVR